MLLRDRGQGSTGARRRGRCARRRGSARGRSAARRDRHHAVGPLRLRARQVDPGLSRLSWASQVESLDIGAARAGVRGDEHPPQMMRLQLLEQLAELVDREVPAAGLVLAAEQPEEVPRLLQVHAAGRGRLVAATEIEEVGERLRQRVRRGRPRGGLCGSSICGRVRGTIGRESSVALEVSQSRGCGASVERSEADLPPLAVELGVVPAVPRPRGLAGFLLAVQAIVGLRHSPMSPARGFTPGTREDSRHVRSSTRSDVRRMCS